MRTIIIFCDGGLGNRFGVLIGGLITADVMGLNPVICWPENSWCGCSFEDLYESKIPVINDDINTLFKNNLHNVFLIHENQTNFNLSKVFNHSEHNMKIIGDMNEDVVYYHNQVPPYYGISKVVNKIKTLKIREDIVKIVKSFCTNNEINQKTIGIHFRKTDVPNQLNEDYIYSKIIENMGTKHYICSDDKAAEDKFKTLPNVFVYPKTSYVEKLKDGGWNDVTTDAEGRTFTFNVNRPKQSVIEAFVDLLILSRTNMVVNSVSSFLRFAKLYSNIEL